jgi:hypothetical protein
MKGKVLLLSLVVVALCGSSALALAPMGPTTPSLKKGQWGFGAEYTGVDMKLSRSATTGSFKDPDNISLMYMNMETNQYSVVVRRGITDNWEGFARIGFADMEYDRPAGSGEWQGDDDDIFLGLGARAAIWEQTPCLRWGILGQATWAEFNGSRANPSSSEVFGKFEIEYTELQIAVGPTWTPKEWDWLSIYGGVFYHDLDGYHTFWHADDYREYPLREHDDLGFYIGGQVAASEKVTITIEFMDTGDADALVLGAMWVPNGL